MKKISIVVPCYGTEKYIGKCLDSLINQTYKNIQIVAVNDCSNGNMLEILKEYAKKDDRIKVVNNEKNQGLYKSRIIGSKACDGDYISFVDSDDYVGIDYYRSLLKSITDNNADISISTPVIHNKKGDFVFNLMKETGNKVLSGEEIMNEYFSQEGQNYRWHIIADKLIDINIWKSALPHYEKLSKRLMMTEDFIFSTIVMYLAKRITFCDDACYYYCENSNQSTSTKNISIEKTKNNIKDIINSFQFIRDFLKEKKILKKYSENLDNWECYYLDMHIKMVDDSIKNDVLKEVNEKIDFNKISDRNNFEKNDTYYLAYSKYNNGLDEIKRNIIDSKTKVISFDLFDTLVVRPFYLPSDMFQLLDKEFIKKVKCSSITKFSKIRIEAEETMRIINRKKSISEVTLEEIYDYIKNTYDLDKKIANYFKKREIELELEFCKKRKTGFSLYELAKDFNKKIIITSDIYLDEKTIRKLLKQNGYNINNIYLSSSIKKTKAKGDLYDYIVMQEKVNPEDIVHIGDNYSSDYKNAKEKGINALHLPRTINAMMDIQKCGKMYECFDMFNIDVRPYIYNYGVRCSIALVANKFFDNPFVSFCENSTFNANPFLLGYYGLGMNLLSIGTWLLKDTKKSDIDELAFMSRDGLLPLKACKIIQNNTNINKNTKLDYIYISRKALLPLIFSDKASLNMIDTYLTSYNQMTPLDLKREIEVILIDVSREEYIKFIKNNNFNEKSTFKNKDQLIKFTNLIYDKYFSVEKYNNYYNIVKEYFEKFYKKKSSTFDIGYSGKPEAIISQIIDKPIKTYFIHANSSDAYNNSCMANYDLNTFYDYKPTLTGTIRELLYSDINPSCIGYKKENNVVIPIFGNEEKYTNYNIEIISEIQNSALNFINDFTTTFGEYYDLIDINKFYLSMPYEYYLHYSKYYDNILIKNLIFYDNINNELELSKFIDNEFAYYKEKYNKSVIYEDLISKEEIRALADNGYGKLPKNRIIRMLYYFLFDRDTLNKKYVKWKEKINEPEQLPQSRLKRIIYYIIFNKSKIIDKIHKK